MHFTPITHREALSGVQQEHRKNNALLRSPGGDHKQLLTIPALVGQLDLTRGI
jgi:hypothetical protein